MRGTDGVALAAYRVRRRKRFHKRLVTNAKPPLQRGGLAEGRYETLALLLRRLLFRVLRGCRLGKIHWLGVTVTDHMQTHKVRSA